VPLGSLISSSLTLLTGWKDAGPAFTFLDPGPLVDGELELVAPEVRWVDDVLVSCHHPLTCRDMPVQGRTTREQLLHYLAQHPRGLTTGNPHGETVPAYAFWLRLRPESRPPVPMAGAIGLRIGRNQNLEMYLGHIGYHVYPPARGHRYAERACRLLLPLAKAHGFGELWITTNPDNTPSRKTCERLGGTMEGIVAVPRNNALYSQGDRQKCRYRVPL
jgi:tagatose 1,6-diphosphate aldolase